ncbi:hypothetical protein [Lactobacillus helveticus]|uniref:hypothetical protein n=1 Tax=Lactobacillus helveticus TaxID=1587 RepID=UPI000E5753CC|nr:hypothetical protein [Lactobacillus helveticus]RHX81871.1 hypothetical protein DSY27_03065 [Lactobacillus helveticus]
MGVAIRYYHYSEKNENYKPRNLFGVVDKSEAWLEREVKAAGYNGINDVFLGECIDRQLRLTGYSK